MRTTISRRGARAPLTTTGLLASNLAWVGAAAAYDFAPPPPGLPPDAINTFQVYVGDEETYDDNLFRLPPGTAGVPGSPIPNASHSDSVNAPAIGGEGRWDVGRQQFDLRAQASDVRFARNTSLDFVGANGVGNWDWLVGPYLSGQAGVDYDRTLASFGQTRFSGFDLVTSTDEHGSARYQLGPHWAVYGALKASYSDHSSATQKFNNFHDKSGDVGVQYANNANNTYGAEYQYVDINFDQPAGSLARGFDYKEDSVRFLVHYSLTDKTVLDGYAGYLRRQYPGEAISAFSGETGRLTVTYTATGKTQLIASAWRELHAYIDAESNYFVAQGVSASPVWNATEKISLSLLASFENQDYIDSNSVVVLSPRHDKLNTEQATLRYSPRDALIFNLFVRHEKRSSNQYAFSYDDNLVSGSVTFRFW